MCEIIKNQIKIILLIFSQMSDLGFLHNTNLRANQHKLTKNFSLVNVQFRLLADFRPEIGAS